MRGFLIAVFGMAAVWLMLAFGLIALGTSMP